MSRYIKIRNTEAGDIPSLEKLYHAAFLEEDLWPLVTDLLNDTQNTFHLTALRNEAIVGHIVFTACHASPDHISLSLLGPIAVFPAFQRQGIGSRLIKQGLDLLAEQQVSKVLVLGDPDFYGRSGFIKEEKIEPTYPIPEHYKPGWQSISLTTDGFFVSGKLQVPTPWQRTELWSD